MKKLFAALAGILGIAWLRRKQAAPAPAVDPAQELRAKLAEQREPAAPEPEPEPEAPQQDVAERRSAVHDRARQATEDLSTPEE